MKLKISSFSEEKQIVRSNLTCQQIGLNEEGLTDPVKVEVKVAKSSSCLTVECNIEVKTNFHCDRCLDEYDGLLNTKAEFIVTSDTRIKADSDEIIFISSAVDEVDISKNIRDAILLAIPYKRICSPQCRGLCPSCGKNLNDGPCDCHDETIDPRWEKLKNLK
mgnify:CR=1 FL=1